MSDIFLPGSRAAHGRAGGVPAIIHKRRAATACPACGEHALDALFELESVPVACLVPCSTAEKARAVPHRDMRLVLCRACGLVYNVAFDESLIDYSTGYENSLHFSEYFQRYARTLARRLIARNHLRGARVVEIGCGSGEFLALLRKAGAGSAIGFDPAPGNPAAPADGIHIVPDDFSSRYSTELSGAGLVCCRHVLEHVANPLAFLREVRKSLHVAPDAHVFFEVPDAGYMFRFDSLWDLTYEHCSYFSRPALVRLFETAGFAVQRAYTTFTDQFLCVEARLASRPQVSLADPEVSDLATMQSFAAAAERALGAWRERLASWRRGDVDVALWGAGTKGTMFLNLVDGTDVVRRAVDVNPRKRGNYVPGTGHPIVAPGDLESDAPDVVLLANPAYEAEVGAALRQARIDAAVDLIAAGG